MSVFSPHSTQSASDSMAKNFVIVKIIFETWGEGASRHSQGFMTNQFPKNTSTVLACSSKKLIFK